MTAKKRKNANKAIIGKEEKIGSKRTSAGGRDSGSGQLVTTKKSGKSRGTIVSGKDPLPPRDRVVKASVDSVGRILVPAKLRKALDLAPGDDVNLELKGDVLEIRSIDDAIDDAQAVLRKYVPKKKHLVDELINERRAEAAKE